MLSSKDGLFDRARGSMVGAVAYLTKPFTKDSLLAAVREHTGGAVARIRKPQGKYGHTKNSDRR
jgi:twitching motility two-component system response regulator PilG